MRVFCRKLKHDRAGAALAEFALLFPAFAFVFFGMLEVGYMMYQVQQGEIAAKRAVRIAITRNLLDGTIADCGPGTGTTSAGTLCSATTPSSSNWGGCTGDAPSSPCGPEVANVVQEIQAFYPRAGANNIQIQFSESGLGFAGLGRPVPIVTVNLTGIQYNPIMMGVFASFTMPTQSASAPAEDLTNGPS